MVLTSALVPNNLPLRLIALLKKLFRGGHESYKLQSAMRTRTLP